MNQPRSAVLCLALIITNCFAQAEASATLAHFGRLTAQDSDRLMRQMPQGFQEFRSRDDAFQLSCTSQSRECQVHFDASKSQPTITHISLTGTGQYIQALFLDSTDRLRLSEELLFPLSSFESEEVILQTDITGQAVRVPRFSMACFSNPMVGDSGGINCLAVWVVSDQDL